MISLSELILDFFGGGVLSCAVLSCAVDIFKILFEGCDLPQCFSLLHVAVSSTSFTYTFSNTYSHTYT